MEWVAIIIAAIIAVTGTRAQIVSDKRQQWIDGLREDIAALVELLHDAKSNKGEIYKIGTRVELRLNPHEEAHNALLALLRDARITCCDSQHDYDTMANNIINATKPILKSEWKRIKFESEFYWPIVSPVFRLIYWIKDKRS